MPLPTILLGFILSTLYGAGFHFLRGGNIRRLAIDLLLAWVGFWIGDQLGWYLGWTFWPLGLLNAGMATVVSLVFLLVGELISHIHLSTPQEEQ